MQKGGYRMIYITGDTHIPYDVTKLTTKAFPEQKKLTKNDYVLICGDFGGVWTGPGGSDDFWLRWFKRKRFTTLFVDGNHENFSLLNQYPVELWNGGKVHRVTDHVIHLMRGQLFTLDGCKIFTMGGGASGDVEFRTEGVSWWPEEMPNAVEYGEAMRTLMDAQFAVDYVVTHTAPLQIVNQFRKRPREEPFNRFLFFIDARLHYKRWYFGHVHKDLDVDERHTAVYQNLLPLGQGQVDFQPKEDGWWKI